MQVISQNIRLEVEQTRNVEPPRSDPIWFHTITENAKTVETFRFRPECSSPRAIGPREFALPKWKSVRPSPFIIIRKVRFGNWKVQRRGGEVGSTSERPRNNDGKRKQPVRSMFYATVYNESCPDRWNSPFLGVNCGRCAISASQLLVDDVNVRNRAVTLRKVHLVVGYATSMVSSVLLLISIPRIRSGRALRSDRQTYDFRIQF